MITKTINTPLSKYKRGHPCKFGFVTGRIITESPEGKWESYKDTKVYSRPYFATPEGLFIEAPFKALRELNKEELIRLEKRERNIYEETHIIYGGKITNLIFKK